MEAQEPFFQALEVHFQPLDAQNEAKETFVWAKEAGATLPVRKCAASSAGGFLSWQELCSRRRRHTFIYSMHGLGRTKQSVGRRKHSVMRRRHSGRPAF